MMPQQTELNPDSTSENIDAEVCDSVEKVWQNQLVAFGYVTLAVAVAYALIAPVLLIQS